MKYLSTNIQQTYNLASEIAKTLKGGEIILLNGTLGAGKTTFTKGLFLALGVNKTVSSPTFTILKEYSGENLMLYHLDMYRLTSEDEVMALGIEEIFNNNAVVVIEWNKISHFNGKVIKININYINENTREFQLEGEYEKFNY